MCGNASRASFTNGSVAGSGSSVPGRFVYVWKYIYRRLRKSLSLGERAAPPLPFSLSSFTLARTRAEFFNRARALLVLLASRQLKIISHAREFE